MIEPQFDGVQTFAVKDRAAVKQNDLWGFINKKGDVVIPPQYYRASDFYADGCALVLQTGGCGIVGKNGQLAVRVLFDDVNN